MSNKKRIQKKIKLIERRNSIYKFKIQIKINLDGSFEDAQKIFEEQN